MKRTLEETELVETNTPPTAEKKQKPDTLTPYEQLLDLIKSKEPQGVGDDEYEWPDDYEYDSVLKEKMDQILPLLEFESGKWLQDYVELFTLALDTSINYEFLESLAGTSDKLALNIRREIFDYFFSQTNRHIMIFGPSGITMKVLNTNQFVEEYLNICYVQDDYQCWSFISGYPMNGLVRTYGKMLKQWFDRSVRDNDSKKFFEKIFDEMVDQYGPQQRFMETVLEHGTYEKVKYMMKNHPPSIAPRVLECTVRSIPFGHYGTGVVQCSHDYSHYYVLIPEKDFPECMKGTVVRVEKDIYYYIQDLQRKREEEEKEQ